MRRWSDNDVRVWIVLRHALMDGSSWACRVRGTIVRGRRWCASNTCQTSKSARLWEVRIDCMLLVPVVHRSHIVSYGFVDFFFLTYVHPAFPFAANPSCAITYIGWTYVGFPEVRIDCMLLVPVVYRSHIGPRKEGCALGGIFHDNFESGFFDFFLTCVQPAFPFAANPARAIT